MLNSMRCIERYLNQPERTTGKNLPRPRHPEPLSSDEVRIEVVVNYFTVSDRAENRYGDTSQRDEQLCQPLGSPSVNPRGATHSRVPRGGGFLQARICQRKSVCVSFRFSI